MTENKITNYEERLFNDSILLDSDSNATIVLLNREIVALQDELATSNANLRFFEAQNDKFGARAKAAEKEVRQKNTLLGILIRESHQRVSVLEEAICEFRARFAGALPIESVERFNDEFTSVKEQKERLDAERDKIHKEKVELEDALDKFKVKVSSMQEVINAIRLGSKDRDVEKMQEWQRKMEEIKISDYKNRRRLIDFEEENKSLRSIVISKENQMTNLETELEQKRAYQPGFENENSLFQMSHKDVILCKKSMHLKPWL